MTPTHCTAHDTVRYVPAGTPGSLAMHWPTAIRDTVDVTAKIATNKQSKKMRLVSANERCFYIG